MMERAVRRLETFLENYAFFSNNIGFRIKSSKALEKWKNIQSFQLNQIANGKYHFHPQKREILLLKYDLWTRWITEIENLMIEMSENSPENVITEEQICGIIKLADKTTSVYKDIILDKHKDRFHNLFSKAWLETHELVYDIMLTEVRGLAGFRFDISFTALVDILSSVMQYTLLELHELNDLFCYYNKDSVEENKGKTFEEINTPFMIITKMDELSYNLTGKYLVVERFKIYKKRFGITSTFFKNYSGQQIPKEIFEQIEETGTNIKYKLNY